MENIGIVITKYLEDRIEGYLAKADVSIELDSKKRIRVNPKIKKDFFTIYSKDNIFEVASGTDISQAREIGLALRNIIFSYPERDIKLRFNDKLYYFDDTQSMYECNK